MKRSVVIKGQRKFVITFAASQDEAEDIAAEWRHFGAPCKVYSGQAVDWQSYESDDPSLAVLDPSTFIIAGPMEN